MLRGVTLFDFMVAGPWYGPVLGDHLVGCGVVTNDWCALFRLYVLVICDHRPQSSGDVEDFDFVSAFPNSNHHTVGTAICQNHDSPQSVIILHCHVCLFQSNTHKSSALWRQCKSKITAHSPGYPRPSQGLG